MGEVATLVEAHRQDRVARAEDCHVRSQVGIGSGVRLHVGMLGAEQGLEPFSGEVFDLVDDLITAVVAATWISFGVLVSQR